MNEIKIERLTLKRILGIAENRIEISKLTDLGGRIFEIFYVCESYKEVTKQGD